MIFPQNSPSRWRHGVESRFVRLDDKLSPAGGSDAMRDADLILTNPPFGPAGGRPGREDFNLTTHCSSVGLTCEVPTAIYAPASQWTRIWRTKMRPIPIGTKGHFELVVEPHHLASQLKDLILPSVFATPMMVLVMENAALNAVREFLELRRSCARDQDRYTPYRSDPCGPPRSRRSRGCERGEETRQISCSA